MRSSFCLLTSVSCLLSPLFCIPALAAVSGTITNATTGSPQAGVTVNLVQPGQQGMQQLGTTTSGADGSFSFDATPAQTGPALVQATYRDITYTQIMPPGRPTTGVTVNVFEVSAQPPAGLLTNHLMLLEPGVDTLRINETFLIQNNSNVAYNDPANGTVRLYLAPGAPENLSMQVDSTGVPVQRPLVKTNTPGLYKVDYAARPGDTRYDLVYSIPATAKLANKVVASVPPMQIVTPAAVTLSGTGIVDKGLQQLGEGASAVSVRLYEVTGASYEISITGTGALRNPASEASPEDSGAPKCCEEAPAQIHEKMPWILTLGFVILALGGVFLYRRGAA